MINIDFERFDRAELIPEAHEIAVEMANQAHAAGLDEATQLEHGIKAYVLGLTATGHTIVVPGNVQVPKTMAEAEAMLRLSYSYIRTNDPTREI